MWASDICASGGRVFSYRLEMVERGDGMSAFLFMFKIPIKDPDAAKKKAVVFFAGQGIQVDAGQFKNDDWEGSYQFLPNPPGWVLEITLTDKPGWAFEWAIVKKAKAFFEGV